MEENGADVVQMTIQRKKTSPCLVGPDLDLVVIASGDEEGLGLVEVDAANRSVVFFESINEGSHTIVPQLNSRGMQRNEDPWSRCA